ncbi:hypothetical protein G7K_5978-t2 [Saitoella complicata NRRL Y-17804]|uniref:Uncharacterized protein n=1 Tax=Saitoella complicata (strain BCRC 22490 / CBS 7301 / JCM 7358 / NBRC 10748 / NRRL Y-17804) TaxID=698492 RepID=A0A0E9NPV1_SAICN|nr:hypothetical protein G7K_5978-t2 [Saitoella complicata NRRL Y-17804]
MWISTSPNLSGWFSKLADDDACRSCLSQSGYGWCPMTSTCTPSPRGIFSPIWNSTICGFDAHARWDLRTNPMGCYVSTMTLGAFLFAFVATLTLTLFLCLTYLCLRRLFRRSTSSSDSSPLRPERAPLLSRSSSQYPAFCSSPTPPLLRRSSSHQSGTSTPTPTGSSNGAPGGRGRTMGNGLASSWKGIAWEVEMLERTMRDRLDRRQHRRKRDRDKAVFYPRQLKRPKLHPRHGQVHHYVNPHYPTIVPAVGDTRSPSTTTRPANIQAVSNTYTQVRHYIRSYNLSRLNYVCRPSIHRRNCPQEGQGCTGSMEHERPREGRQGIYRRSSEHSIWRNRDQFFQGTKAIEQFLTDKWSKESGYRLRKELFTFAGNRIAVQFWYEFWDDSGQWWRCYGLEHWTFAEDGKMKNRMMSVNDVKISEGERWFEGDADVNSSVILKKKSVVISYRST